MEMANIRRPKAAKRRARAQRGQVEVQLVKGPSGKKPIICITSPDTSSTPKAEIKDWSDLRAASFFDLPVFVYKTQPPREESESAEQRERVAAARAAVSASKKTGDILPRRVYQLAGVKAPGEATDRLQERF